MNRTPDTVLTFAADDLPADWTARTIGDLVGDAGVFVDGDWVESKDQDPNGDVRLVQLADIGDGEYRDRSARFLTGTKATELGCTFLQEGDVLIARMPDPLGRACIFPGDEKTAVTVVDVAIVRSAAGNFNHRWLMYFVNAPAFRAAVASMQSGSTRKRISRGNLAKIVLPVPPPDAQVRIVTEIEKQFSRLDDAVANLNRVKANLKRYKAAVLKAAVEGRLVETEAELARREGRSYEPAEHLLTRISRDVHSPTQGKRKRARGTAASTLDDLPEGWTWATYGQVGTLQLGRQRAPRYHSGPHMRPYLRVQNVFEDRIDLSDVMEMDFPPPDFEKYELKPGDLLLNEGQSPELLGRPAIYRGELPGSCFTNTLIRFRAADGVTVDFALLVSRHFMRSGRFAKEGTITTNIAHLSVGRLSSVGFPLPPTAEQERIVAEADRLLSFADSVEVEANRQIKRAAQLHHAYLFSAFSGRLKASEPSTQ